MLDPPAPLSRPALLFIAACVGRIPSRPSPPVVVCMYFGENKIIGKEKM